MYKNNRKEHLYSVALKLFLTKRYEGVSISDIEKASGMTRGAISYYGKDKLGLFYNVIKHCLVDKQNLDYKMNPTPPRSLQEFIENYIQGCRETLENLRDIDRSITNGSRGYMALILQICDFFPDLNEQYLTNRNNELLRWIEIINLAIRENEIRGDIDVLATAKSFMNIFYGQSFLDALSVGLNIMDLKLQFQNLYNLLKQQ
ncbi:MAG: TetR/AcrR family transcriptional regulator [Muribaculaceae bacterium]|nr:TetR/AcrR family transcriptional regulator [Muribaculaceae bacterium]